MIDFNQLNIERMEMCFVQHVEIKIFITFQSMKRLVSTTVKSANPVATF